MGGNLKPVLKKARAALFNSLPMTLRGPLHTIVTGRYGRRRAFLRRNVGPHSYVDPSVMIFGWKNVHIGRNTTISQDVWLNANFRDDPEKKIIIGNSCHIAKGSYFSCGPLIELKDYCFTGFNCNFLGCGHRFDSPMVPYIASGLYPGDQIKIGVNCWLAGNVTVLEGVTIGHGSVVGAGTLVTRDIPPFSLAVGNPGRVIRRYDFSANRWINMDEWRSENDALMPTEEDYLRQLNDKYGDLPLALISSGKRFGWL